MERLPWWKQTLDILKAAGKEFGEDNAGRKAAALSYYTIFSLVPLLFIVVAAAGFVSASQGDSADSMTHQLLAYVNDVAGSTVQQQIADIVGQIEAQASGALSIGIVLALFSASTIFMQIQGVLGVIFQVPEDRQRKGVVGMLVQRGIGALAAILLALLAFAPIAAVAAVGWIPDSWGPVKTAAQFSVPILALILLMVVVGLTFQFMTVVEIPWKAALRGGAATAIFGLLAAWLVGLYLARSGGGSGVSALGVLGGAVILLFFFNLLWTVYLLGAEVTKVYGDYLEFGDVVQPSERRERQHPALDRIHPISRRQPGGSDDESTARVGMTAFVLGALFGWVGGRRK